MPFASSSALHSLRSRSIPLLTASALSISIYTLHTYASPLLADDQLPTPLYGSKKTKTPVGAISSDLINLYTPLGWGSNRHLTLFPDPNTAVVKRPLPLTHLGATPLRDLVIAEKYGACVDAIGDCWMWGTGYDPSGDIGRSLKGKGIISLAPARAKIVALSKNGKLFVVSASKAFQDSRQYQSERSWWNWLFGTDPGVDFIELGAEGGLRRGEKFTGVSTGIHHVLAVTNKGRTFSLPLSPSANSHRQLGTRQVFDLPYPTSPSGSSAASSASVVSVTLSPELPPEADIRFATTLAEIPSLQGTTISQVAVSDRTSFVRTPTGRILGWGANDAGQIGLGGNAAMEMVQVPIEIVLARNYPGGTVVKCLDVKTGGQMTLFTVERNVPGKGSLIDLLACGNGMSGSLGNGQWSSANGMPARVKTVSGLQEFSDKHNTFLPIGLHSISISPSPSTHIFAVLDTVAQADQKGVKEGIYGKDVMVWGGNSDYQLGNGKRSSLAVPQHLPPLIAHGPTAGLNGGQLLKEAELSSGTPSPMPHTRLQLHQSITNAYDLDGKLIKRGVKCEETMVAGWNASVLYNKIIM